MTGDILLADDEMTFRETMAQVLREESLSVTAVEDGTQALARIREKPYALAILDIQMPGADGIKVLQEIMRRHPKTRVIIGDAREIVQTIDQQYDVIFSEPSNPYRAGIFPYGK